MKFSVERGVRVEIEVILLEERRSRRGQYGCHPVCGARARCSDLPWLRTQTPRPDIREPRTGRPAETLADTVGIKRPSSYDEGKLRIHLVHKRYIARYVYRTKGPLTVDHMRLIGSLLRV